MATTKPLKNINTQQQWPEFDMSSVDTPGSIHVPNRAGIDGGGNTLLNYHSLFFGDDGQLYTIDYDGIIVPVVGSRSDAKISTQGQHLGIVTLNDLVPYTITQNLIVSNLDTNVFTYPSVINGQITNPSPSPVQVTVNLIVGISPEDTNKNSRMVFDVSIVQQSNIGNVPVVIDSVDGGEGTIVNLTFDTIMAPDGDTIWGTLTSHTTSTIRTINIDYVRFTVKQW